MNKKPEDRAEVIIRMLMEFESPEGRQFFKNMVTNEFQEAEQARDKRAIEIIKKYEGNINYQRDKGRIVNDIIQDIERKKNGDNC